MDTTLLIPQDGGQAEKGGIVNDFMYGSNVAKSHIYVRMGTYFTINHYFFITLLVKLDLCINLNCIFMKVLPYFSF